MKRNICFHFQISQPCRLKTYRFFDIGLHHDYFDEYQNHYLANRLAERCYLPANKMFLDLINENDNISLSFSISGTSIRLFKEHCPEIIDSFKKLIATGKVEITGSTFTHSIAALHDKKTFVEQVKLQEQTLKETFGITPTTFCNTELIYSDEIGEWIYELGYKTILTEGAKHILGWKSPGYLYCNPFQTDLKLLLRNYTLCDDLTLRFSDKGWMHYPLTSEKYIGFLKSLPADAPFINLFFDYETIGEYNTKESGIFDFFSCLFRTISNSDEFRFITPAQTEEIEKDCELSVSTMHAPWPISSAGDEKDTSEWTGNELQQEAFEQLFKLEPLYSNSTNENAKQNWLDMQAADHFAFMSTKWLSKSSVRRNFDVYPSPYQAFINYMNVLNDIKIELEKNTKKAATTRKSK